MVGFAVAKEEGEGERETELIAAMAGLVWTERRLLGMRSDDVRSWQRAMGASWVSGLSDRMGRRARCSDAVVDLGNRKLTSHFDNSTWLLDTDANSHITANVENLGNPREYNGSDNVGGVVDGSGSHDGEDAFSRKM
ncbi:hypothetical protein M0R45_019329 [Rubus argutus]|uniref:Uncharacterized protein n=1 Tax=Rubus argutus TaxID=59490 RepID=A0AAW1X722_RUBAR